MASTNIPTKQIVVENVATFRGSQVPLEVCVFPEIRQKRKSTDVAFLIAFGISVVILLALMVYALVNSDMRRFIHGYDSCGNICGSVNTPVDGISCSGQDMTDKPFLQDFGMESQKICVESCAGTPEFNRCYDVDEGFLTYTVRKLQDESVGLTILCFLGLGLSIVALLAFRYFARQFVWTMLILSVLMLFAVCGGMWYLYGQSSDYDRSGLLVSAIIITIVSVVFALCILVLKGRISLIIFFFQESSKIVFTMPLLLLEPVLTFLSTFLVLAIFVYTFLLMGTSGTLQADDYSGGYDYVPNGAIRFAMVWSVIMMLWMVQFVLACQQMVISGAVATYYFARDKLTVISPIYNSFYNLVRYHLGTVAFGSFVITVITIIKITLQGMARQNGWGRLIYYCCLRPIEQLVKYMTSMGYIETAIHGTPLCRSSFRAVNLIVVNLLSSIAMNSIGNFVFFMAKLVVVVITVGVGALMLLPPVIVTFGALVALLCVHCFFVVFEIAVDTVFLCYCEDQSINDGCANPYCASMQLHTEIKKAQALTAALEKAKQKKKK